MTKYKIEISTGNANNIVKTIEVEAKNHGDAMNAAEKLGRPYFNKGLEVWFKAEKMR